MRKLVENLTFRFCLEFGGEGKRGLQGGK